MRVPYLDLKAQYESIRGEIAGALDAVIARTAFAGGPFVEKFEGEFAEFTGSEHAIGVSSGTSALWLTFLALGVEPGDEIITVPYTFIATAETISFCGATPVFVDVDDVTYTMDPALVEAAITPKTKAIVPVHLYGQPANMGPILEIGESHGIPVVEDAAQAHGAEYKGRPAGSLGHAGCFSFYPGKNLGAYGEAGAVVTDDGELAATIRMLRDHGQDRRYYHKMIGWNARMDGMQAAVLSVKLKRLGDWNEARREKARMYEAGLGEIDGVVAPREAEGRCHVYHVYSARVAHRDAVFDALREREIQCGIHYPVPIHLQEAYAHLGLGEGSFPVAERCATGALSLPIYPELEPEQIEFVCSEMGTVLAELGPEA